MWGANRETPTRSRTTRNAFLSTTAFPTALSTSFTGKSSTRSSPYCSSCTEYSAILYSDGDHAKWSVPPSPSSQSLNSNSQLMEYEDSVTYYNRFSHKQPFFESETSSAIYDTETQARRPRKFKEQVRNSMRDLPRRGSAPRRRQVSPTHHCIDFCDEPLYHLSRHVALNRQQGLPKASNRSPFAAQSREWRSTHTPTSNSVKKTPEVLRPFHEFFCVPQKGSRMEKSSALAKNEEKRRHRRIQRSSKCHAAGERAFSAPVETPSRATCQRVRMLARRAFVPIEASRLDFSREEDVKEFYRQRYLVDPELHSRPFGRRFDRTVQQRPTSEPNHLTSVRSQTTRLAVIPRCSPPSPPRKSSVSSATREKRLKSQLETSMVPKLSAATDYKVWVRDSSSASGFSLWRSSHETLEEGRSSSVQRRVPRRTRSADDASRAENCRISAHDDGRLLNCTRLAAMGIPAGRPSGWRQGSSRKATRRGNASPNVSEVLRWR